MLSIKLFSATSADFLREDDTANESRKISKSILMYLDVLYFDLPLFTVNDSLSKPIPATLSPMMLETCREVEATSWIFLMIRMGTLNFVGAGIYRWKEL